MWARMLVQNSYSSFSDIWDTKRVAQSLSGHLYYLGFFLFVSTVGVSFFFCSVFCICVKNWHQWKLRIISWSNLSLSLSKCTAACAVANHWLLNSNNSRFAAGRSYLAGPTLLYFWCRKRGKILNVNITSGRVWVLKQIYESGMNAIIWQKKSVSRDWANAGVDHPVRPI